MAKRRPRLSTTAQRMRQWRGCGVVTLVGVVFLTGVSVFVNFLRKEPSVEDHPHRPAPHGGVLVSLVDDDDHYHVEAFVEKAGFLKLHTFGEDAGRVVEVETQLLTAYVRPEGDGKPVPVDLMPMPQTGDVEGKTSRFAGKLPEALGGNALGITVPGLIIVGKRFRLDFTIANDPGGSNPSTRAKEEQKLFLTPGGKYSVEDIQANGNQTAALKYREFQAIHDLRPRPGEKICPVTRTKANPQYLWVIGGKAYEFCCPPCIDEFVRTAKERPEQIKEPEGYVKK